MPHRISHSLTLQNVFNFCKGRGHWEADSPKAIARRGNNGGQVNSAACAVSVEPVPVVAPIQQVKFGEPCRLEEPDFSPFVSGGFVLLVGSNSVPVKMLKDTAVYDSYILSSVLSFSDDSATGDFVLMQGMGLNAPSEPQSNLVEYVNGFRH